MRHFPWNMAFALGSALLAAASAVNATTLDPIYAFTSFGRPYSGVTLHDGALYGVTSTGGSENYGEVFQLTAPVENGSNWQFNVLLNFTGADPGGMSNPLTCKHGIGGPSAAAGSEPLGRPVFDAAGHMFVSAVLSGCASGWGTIVQMSAGPDKTWSASSIVELGPPYVHWPYGSGPENYGGMSITASGALIATATAGGTANCGGGTVVSLSPSLTGSATLLKCFPFAPSPFNIESGVTIGSDGTIYGVAQEGGQNDAGAVHGSTNTGPMASSIYALVPRAGGGWSFKTLYRFSQGSTPDSFGPSGPLLLGPDNTVWGVATGGDGCGSVYSLAEKPGGSFLYTRVYVFQCGDDGNTPAGNLAMDGTGALYGATIGGGVNGFGTLFKLVP